VTFATVDIAFSNLTFTWYSSQSIDIGCCTELLSTDFAPFPRSAPISRQNFVEMDGEDNHVHLLVNYPAKHSIATLLNSLKGVSSSMLRRERPDLRPRYWKGVLWSPSYFAASCGGAPIGILKAYLEQQKKPL
jgi:putative transposase